MEIYQERLEREFDLDLVTTANVPYRITKNDGVTVEVTGYDIPEDGWDFIEEPVVEINFMVPADYVGAVMQLATSVAVSSSVKTTGQSRCVLSTTPHLPKLCDLDKLKSSTCWHHGLRYHRLR